MTARKQTQDRTQNMPCPELLPNNHSPTHAMEGVNHMLIPKLSGQLCCLLQLSRSPANRSSEGDTQSSSIVIGIMVVDIYTPAVLPVYCVEGTTAISCSVNECRMQHVGPNDGLYDWCWNWRHITMAILTSAQKTKWTWWSSFPIPTQLLIICGMVVDAPVVE